jgi:hypothetical protein
MLDYLLVEETTCGPCTWAFHRDNQSFDDYLNSEINLAIEEKGAEGRCVQATWVVWISRCLAFVGVEVCNVFSEYIEGKRGNILRKASI